MKLLLPLLLLLLRAGITALGIKLRLPPSGSPLNPAASAPPRSCYVHLPFCRRRCFYCDFSIAVVGDSPKQGVMDRYVETLRREIRATAEAHGPAVAAAGGLETLYFGGGTPSLVPPDLLATVVRELREGFGPFSPGCEVTLEMDPGTFDAARLAAKVLGNTATAGPACAARVRTALHEHTPVAARAVEADKIAGFYLGMALEEPGFAANAYEPWSKRHPGADELKGPSRLAARFSHTARGPSFKPRSYLPPLLGGGGGSGGSGSNQQQPPDSAREKELLSTSLRSDQPRPGESELQSRSKQMPSPPKEPKASAGAIGLLPGAIGLLQAAMEKEFPPAGGGGGGGLSRS